MDEGALEMKTKAVEMMDKISNLPKKEEKDAEEMSTVEAGKIARAKMKEACGKSHKK
jgi:hypothetical protein